MTDASENTDFFYTPSLKGLMQQLVHLANFGDGFSVVLGPKGSGKTRVSNEIQKHFDGAQQLVKLNLTEGTELAESLALLADSFGLPQGDDLSVGELLSELRHFVQALAQDKKLLVLVVDNAHYFDDQAIGALVSLLQGGAESNFGLHLILFSEPGLETRIDRLQILDIAVYDFEIPHFSPTEMSSFLDVRNTSVQQLTTSQVQKIWSLSKGLPGPALRALYGQDASSKTNSDKNDPDLGGADSKESEGKSKIPLGHIAAIVLLACVLFWSITWHTSEKVEVPEPSGESGQAISLEKPAGSLSVETRESEVEGQQGQDEGLPESDSDDSESVDSPISELSSSVANTQSQYTKMDKVKNATQQDVSSFSQKKNAEVARMSTPAPQAEGDISKDVVKDDENITESSLQDEAIGIREAPKVIPDSESYEESLVTARPEDNVEESAEPLKLTNDEAFILAQNPNFYALQVIAASKKDSLEAYIQRQSNRDKLRMYRGAREGKSWFVVVEGVYSTRDSAMNARMMLPKEQSKAGPWPRLFSSIQEEIETFRRQ